MDERALRPSVDRAVSRRDVLRLGAGVAVASLAGCLDTLTANDPEGDWPTFAHDAANTGATTAAGPSEPAERWTAEIGLVSGSPAVVGDTVYAVGADESFERSTLYALSAASGDERWTFEADYSVRGSPSVVDDTTYVAGNRKTNRDGVITAVDDEGDERWTAETSGGILGPVSVDDGIVTAVTTEGVYSVAAESGDEEWTTTNPRFTPYPPALVDGTAYVGSQEYANAIDAADGEERWRYTGEGAEQSGSTSAGTVVGDGSVYFGTMSGENLVAVDVESGERQWGAEHHLLTQPPALAHDTLYAGFEPGAVFTEIADTTGSRIVAIDAASGEDRWTFDRYGTEEYGLAPSVGDDVVYARTFGGLYALDSSDGEVMWEFDGPFGLPWDEDGPFDRPPNTVSYLLTSSPAIVEGLVVVGSLAGGVYAVGDA